MTKTTKRLECPYNQCGQCLYVGPDVQIGQTCPICGDGPKGGVGVWPQVQWTNAAQDIMFLCEHRKLELLTIAAAAYFEGVLHVFLRDGMWFIYEPTRVAERCQREEIQDSADRFLAEARETKSLVAKQEQLLSKYRYRAGHRGRMGGLCKKLYRETFDELLHKHCGDVRVFVVNRDNIADWRNRLLHQGTSLGVIWPDDVRTRIPGIVQDFLRQCWDVFRVLYNELIHKPWWQEHKDK